MTDARHALIIANDRYTDQGLKQLKAPAQDAAALAGVLHDPQIGDFDVDVVRNAPADAMRRRIQGFFSDRRRDDTLVLHFSCHGLKSESGELYFAASDTEPRLLDATAIPAQFVRGCMSRTRAGRTVLFLDCCYGGAFSRGSPSVRATGEVNVLESFTRDRPGGRGWAVITASNSMEFAFEGDELAENSAPRPSVFTHAVVEGLATGEADLDADGEVSLDDLYDYVYEHVQEQNPNQTPSKTVEMQGELQLAHSRRGRIKIAAIPSPPSLLAAVNSDNAFTRQGAVLELRSRLQNESLPLAEGARQALEDVARNDIRQIADEASRALRDIRLAPSPDRLDFGLVPKGSPLQEKSVTMNGPPLARHCVAQPAQSWLRVEPTANGFTVRVDATTEGRLSGDIALKGVADEAVVHVEAVVGPSRDTRPPEATAEPANGSVHDPDTVVVAPSDPRTGADGTSAPTVGDGMPQAGTGPSHAGPHGKGAHHADPHGKSPQQGGQGQEGTGQAAPERAGTGQARPEQASGRAGLPSHRASALAGAALALAATAAVTVILGIRAVVVAALDRGQDGPTGDLDHNVHQQGVLPLLTVTMITAVLALVVVAFARHDLETLGRRDAEPAVHGTRSMASVAKGLAVPALIVAVLILVGYMIAAPHW
ncbi:caspase domain-containing protein [Streptomyces rishiriensis]|uniref:caspase domain-containing protein n=1 Tax=Streptomyces rishiriensis TaxID=68264 RepID=UPI0037D628BE